MEGGRLRRLHGTWRCRGGGAALGGAATGGAVCGTGGAFCAAAGATGLRRCWRRRHLGRRTSRFLSRLFFFLQNFNTFDDGTRKAKPGLWVFLVPDPPGRPPVQRLLTLLLEASTSTSDSADILSIVLETLLTAKPRLWSISSKALFSMPIFLASWWMRILIQ